jgi:alanyl-tRNA synthetase
MEESINPYDDTTLFCPSGMQQFKSNYKDLEYKNTLSNIQPCLRLNDLEEIGDGTHLLYFNMIGLFSFRELTLEYTIDFWIEFLNLIGITPDYVTLHPDKLEWSDYYTKHNIEIRLDLECLWSDGEIGGYCTEFYKNGIEIGNIVNTLGTCIDVGFGLERLLLVSTGKEQSKGEVLRDSILKIIESGYEPNHYKQGYVLKRLLRICYRDGIEIDHQYYLDEVKRQDKIKNKYLRLKRKHIDMPKDWWWNTH